MTENFSEADQAGTDELFTAAELEAAIKVLGLVHRLFEPEDERHVAVRRATGKMFKAAKRHRKNEKRSAINAADRAVVERTATGSPAP